MYIYQKETIEESLKLKKGTIAHQNHIAGIDNNEPLIVCMDGLLRYAKAHKTRFDNNLQNDYVLGDYWLEAVKGIRGLLNGDGAIALETGNSQDSKDNGCIEGVFWSAMKIAGFTEEDL